MARSDEKVPLAMVCSLLSYSESRLRLWRSWNASTRRQAILLAFSNLKDTAKWRRRLILLSLLDKYFQCYGSVAMAQSQCLHADNDVLSKKHRREYQWDGLTRAAEKTVPRTVLWKSLWSCSHIVPCKNTKQFLTIGNNMHATKGLLCFLLYIVLLQSV